MIDYQSVVEELTERLKETVNLDRPGWMRSNKDCHDIEAAQTHLSWLEELLEKHTVPE